MGINYIGNDAFSYNLELKSVEIPEGVRSINFEAFSECENLKTVIFPQTLETIGYQAFDYCFSIKEFSFPENLTYIGDEAFAQCDSLENIEFRNTENLELGERVFIGCALNNNLKFKIKAFDGCDLDNINDKLPFWADKEEIADGERVSILYYSRTEEDELKISDYILKAEKGTDDDQIRIGYFLYCENLPEDALYCLKLAANKGNKTAMELISVIHNESL